MIEDEAVPGPGTTIGIVVTTVDVILHEPQPGHLAHQRHKLSTCTTISICLISYNRTDDLWTPTLQLNQAMFGLSPGSYPPSLHVLDTDPYKHFASIKP